MDTKLQLVRQAKQGNAQAFAALYQNIYHNLYRFALYTLGNPTDAEDAVGDTVADAWAAIGKLRKEESFESWMFQILHNKCRRRRKEYLFRPLEWTDALGDSASNDDLDQKYHLRRAFGELADKDRAIISLHVFGGYTSQEIARITGMKANTVRSRESRALKKLARQLEE